MRLDVGFLFPVGGSRLLADIPVATPTRREFQPKLTFGNLWLTAKFSENIILNAVTFDWSRS